MIRAAVLCFCLAASPAVAEVEGATDPDLRAAVALWLAGDEASALPHMADLARADNSAAQLLLALIDTTSAWQGPWLSGLSRDDRITLMRQPGGLSGKSFLDQAKGPLAAAWRRLLDTSATPDVIFDFAAMGEDRAATFAARILKRRQNTDLAGVMASPATPAYLARFGGGAWTPAADDPAHAPFSATCAAICPEDGPACAAALAEALSGDLHMAGPPSEQIIPPADWAASPRAQSALLRLAATSGWRGAAPQCLGQALAATE